MSIASEITRINNNIASAYTACDNKGATMPQTQNSANLANTINSIPEGGGAPVRNSLNLYDWEGTLLQSYSYAEAQALESLPQSSGVTHELMTFQEWHWSLSDIKTWLTAHPHGQLDVGAIYTTTDGQDHNYWDNPRLTYNNLISMQKRGSALPPSTTFSDYYNLTYISISKNTTNVKSNLFASLPNLQFVALPSTVTNIYERAFQRCHSFESILIPNSVSSISNNAFLECYNLKNIVLPKNLTTITQYCFGACTSLKNIYIPKGVTKLEANSFYDCTALDKICIPSSVIAIENNAFVFSYSLNDIVIEGKPSLANATFRECPSTVRFYAYRDNLSYFQSATNWSTYYDKFVAIEDYTDYLNSIGIDLQGAS